MGEVEKGRVWKGQWPYELALKGGHDLICSY